LAWGLLLPLALVVDMLGDSGCRAAAAALPLLLPGPL
jgi:hypothetical protein